MGLSVDPLAEKYPNYGGYVYTLNNPINFIETDDRKVVSTGMTPAQRKVYDNRITEMRGANKMFNTIYSSLESSSKKHTISKKHHLSQII